MKDKTMIQQIRVQASSADLDLENPDELFVKAEV